MNMELSVALNNIPGREDLDERRLSHFCDRSQTGVATGVAVALLSAAFLHDVMERQILIAWLVIALGICLVRSILILVFRKSSSIHVPRSRRRWEILYGISSTAWGFVWGYLAWSLDPLWPAWAQIFVVVMVVGMTAGSIPSNAASPFSLYSFILLSNGMMAGRMLMTPGFEHIGDMTILFMAMMLMVGRLSHQEIVKALRLGMENRELAADLQRRNEDLRDELAENRRLMEKVRADQMMIRGAFEQSSVAMAVIDKDFCFKKVNLAATDLLQCQESDLIGKSVLDFTHPDDVDGSRMLFEDMLEGKINRYRLRKRYVRKDGQYLWADLNMGAVRDESGAFLYAIGQAPDITEQVLLQERLEHSSRHDALTGLVNRGSFDNLIDDLLNEGKGKHALCYIDLDQFKVVNDTVGHQAGDDLLRQVTGILKSLIRRQDVLARLGGDEFALLMRGCEIENATRVAEEILEAIGQYRFTRDGKTFRIGASIGIVAISPDCSSREEILSRADSACYEAKESGRHCYRIWNDGKGTRTSAEMAWMPRLNSALQDGRFEIDRQAIVPLSGRPAHGRSFECLLRMVGENGDRLPPGGFMPAAERYGLSAEIDTYVVARVADWLKTSDPEEIERCSVNISGATLGNDGGMNKIAEIVGSLGNRSSLLCFEITETAVIGDLQRAMVFMRKLRGLGCSFALDDFGAGLSSFAYLKTLPVDFLKIDGLFTRDLCPINQEMVKAIVGVAHAIGAKTVAEFVETEEDMEVMKSLGVDYAQGFFVGKPEKWLGMEDKSS